MLQIAQTFGSKNLWKRSNVCLAGPNYTDVCQKSIGQDVIRLWFKNNYSDSAPRKYASLSAIETRNIKSSRVPHLMASIYMSEKLCETEEFSIYQEDTNADSSAAAQKEDLWVWEQFCEQLGNTRIRDLIDNKKDQQKSCFFWVPGQPLNGCTATESFNLYPIYIGFFYSWLRSCSHASKVEISKEIGVSVSAITRDWLPDDALATHFLSASFCLNDNVYPVIFSPAALNQIGLFDRKIRCYKKRIYNGGPYNEIWVRKLALWTVYELMLHPDLADVIHISRFENLGQNDALIFDFEIISSEEAGFDDKPKNLLIRINAFKNLERLLPENTKIDPFSSLMEIGRVLSADA
jgi:hypothetical protein